MRPVILKLMTTSFYPVVWGFPSWLSTFMNRGTKSLEHSFPENLQNGHSYRTKILVSSRSAETEVCAGIETWTGKSCVLLSWAVRQAGHCKQIMVVEWKRSEIYCLPSQNTHNLQMQLLAFVMFCLCFGFVCVFYHTQLLYVVEHCWSSYLSALHLVVSQWLMLGDWRQPNMFIFAITASAFVKSRTTLLKIV